MSFLERAALAKNWLDLASAFNSTELPKDQPDFARLLEFASNYPSPQQHGIWITVAEECYRLFRPAWALYAYAEAIVADPTSSSVAWHWFSKLIQEIEKATGEKLSIPAADIDLDGPRPSRPGEQETVGNLAQGYRALALKLFQEPKLIPVKPELQKALDAAVSADNVEQVRALIKEEPRLVNTYYDLHGHLYTPLLQAAEKGNVEVARFLITHGANINIPGGMRSMPVENHTTPLQRAAGQGHIEVVRLLLADGADANDQARPAIHRAAAGGHTEIVSLLIDHGADVNVQYGVFGFTPLHEASNTEVARVLIAHGADVNKPDRYGNRASRWAEKNNHREVAEMLRRLERPH
jgi:hypothetical protein